VQVAGLLLAAGGGRRLGRPKALVDLGGQLLVERGTRMLAAAGCAPVVVVLGAAAERVLAVADLSAAHATVVAEAWPEGVGASLRAGLAALAATEAGAVVVALVDQPLVGAEAARRLVTAMRTAMRAGMQEADDDVGAATLPARVSTGGGASADRAPAAAIAVYAGEPRNPVLLRRPVWAEVAASARGDVGARAWLRAHPERVLAVACDGTGSPDDIDTPADLARLRRR
jgi:CTP:molybdopterin cytidylyltransferase MocA